MMHIFPIIVLVSLFALCMFIGRSLEAGDWNKGYCKKCGKKLRNFDMDSQGGRGYICDNCREVIWISWGVDK